MTDPTDGCPGCGTIDANHADDCERRLRFLRDKPRRDALVAERATKYPPVQIEGSRLPPSPPYHA